MLPRLSEYGGLVASHVFKRQAEEEATEPAPVCEIEEVGESYRQLRIASIFVIFVGSALGAILPIYLARLQKMRVPKLAFFVAKYFGSGVILATAWIHLLAPAAESLATPCLEPYLGEYPWAFAIGLMTVMLMFLIEMLAMRFDMFGSAGHSHGTRGHDPSLAILKQRSHEGSTNGSVPHETRTEGVVAAENGDAHRGVGAATGGKTRVVPGRQNDVSYPPGGEDHMLHDEEHAAGDRNAAFAAQMTAIFILEFGVVFHSIFIGFTLAVASEFIVLFVVLVFHQTFEGLGLGSRLATAPWSARRRWVPYLLGAIYALSTPIAIAVGLGVRANLQTGSAHALIVEGVFDAISAGILMYTALVELLAHEFMFNPHMRSARLRMQLFAYLCVAIGAGLMALLGRWA